jgi:RND family efflux transporter MFP subunit
VLVTLDKSELLSREQEALRSVESARLRVDRSRRDLARQKDLYQKGFASEKVLQDAQTDADLAENDLEIQQAKLQTLREELAKTTVRAPHAGTVLKCDLSEGQVITGADSVHEGTVLMQIADLRNLVVMADVNEVDVTRLALEMPVTLTFDSIPGLTIDGTLIKISPSALVKEGVRVFPIEIACDMGESRLKPGISATVHMTFSEAVNPLAVPLAAVFSSDDGERYVFVQTGDTFARRAVTVGVNDAEYVQIASGLQPGESVALTRPTGLGEGGRREIAGDEAP